MNRIYFRRGTEAEWVDADPILADGEPGVSTDTYTLRFGDGVTPWTQLRAVELDNTKFLTALHISPLPPMFTPPGTIWISCAPGGSFNPTPPIPVPFTGSVDFTGSGALVAGAP